MKLQKELFLSLILLLGGLLPRSCPAQESKAREWVNALRTGDKASLLREAYAYKHLEPTNRATAEIVIRGLKDANPDVRKYCASALGEFDKDVEPIVAALMEALKDSEAAVRQHAAISLAKIGSPAVQPLVRSLGDSTRYSAGASDYAALALLEMGPEAAPALIPLLKRSNDSDLSQRYALYILKEMGDEGIKSLARVANDGSQYSWEEILHTLVDTHSDDDTVLQVYTKYFDRSDIELRTSIMEETSRFGSRALPLVLKELANRDTDIRLNGLHNLFSLEHLNLTPFVIRFLNDRDESMRAEVIQQLSIWGLIEPDPERSQRVATREARNVDRIIHLLLMKLTDKNLEVRLAAVSALGDIDSQKGVSVPALIRLLGGKNRSIQKQTISSLGKIGQQASLAVRPLFKFLTTADAETRGEILEALGSIAAQDPAVHEALIKGLASNDSSSQQHAARGLKAAGRGAGDDIDLIVHTIESSQPGYYDDGPYKEFSGTFLLNLFGVLLDTGLPATPALINLSRNNNATIRKIAAAALIESRFHDERVLTALAALLKDPSPRVRSYVASSLVELGLSAERTSLLLAVALEDEDAGVRSVAVTSLGGLGNGATAVLPALTRRLTDSNAQVRVAAAVAITKIGTNEQSAIQALIKELTIPAVVETQSGGGYSYTYNKAVDGLEEIGQSAVPALVTALKDPNPVVRRNASLILAKLGIVAKTAVAALIIATADQDLEVRKNAIVALEHIGPDAREAEKTLIALLLDDHPEIRLSAANALISVGADLRNIDPSFNTIIYDDFIRRSATDIEDLPNWINPPQIVLAAERGHLLPSFPWPPPIFSDWFALPRNLVGRDNSSLFEVHRRIDNALSELGYNVRSVFDVPGGFALVTRVERINDDGTTLSSPNRWSRAKLAPTSVFDYARRLFFDRPGQFRMFVFVVTTEQNLPRGGQRFSEDEAFNLPGSGGKLLPEEIGKTLFRGHYCHVLLYKYQKVFGEGATLDRDDPFGAEGHLRKSGILNKLRS